MTAPRRQLEMQTALEGAVIGDLGRSARFNMISQIHVFAGFSSLIFGLFVLLRTKGTAIHKFTGRVYVISMITLNATAFGIYELFGGFGIFHILAIVSLLTVFAGMVPVLFRSRFRNWLRLHYLFMSWSYAGLLAATSNEAFVHIDILQGLIRTTTPWLPFLVMMLILIGCASLISRLQPSAIASVTMAEPDAGGNE
jgi:uncharacterized membrane protein